MKVHRLAAGVALLALLLFPVAATYGAVSFVYPQEMSWVKNADFLILKMNNPEITGVRVTVNGQASDILQIGSPEYRRAFRDFLILKSLWDPGKNDVSVECFTGPKKIETATTKIYLIPKSDSQAPPEFKANRFHVATQEKLCMPCHNMNPTADQMAASLEKNPCYGCHKNMLDTAFVHGPAGTFTCNYCHNLQGEPKYAVAKRDSALCNDCHAEKAAEFAKKKFIHGPVAVGMCEVCHDPHGSPYYAQLKAPVNELCLSCHEHVGKGVHVVRTPSGSSHPLSGVPDPSRAGSGRQMSCISCHNPHGGNVRYFFVNDAADRMLLCQMCHNK